MDSMQLSFVERLDVDEELPLAIASLIRAMLAVADVDGEAELLAAVPRSTHVYLARATDGVLAGALFTARARAWVGGVAQEALYVG
jgi:hypothetical protein